MLQVKHHYLGQDSMEGIRETRGWNFFFFFYLSADSSHLPRSVLSTETAITHRCLRFGGHMVMSSQ